MDVNRKRWITGALLSCVIISLILCMSIGCDGADEDDLLGFDLEEDVVLEEETLEDETHEWSGEERTVQEPESKPEATWQNVINVSGNSNKRTDVFYLGSGKKQLLYSVTGDYPIAAIYLMDEGEDLMETGGVPEVLVQDTGSDSTMLVKSPGRYYLEVQSTGCSWEVTIQEYK